MGTKMIVLDDYSRISYETLDGYAISAPTDAHIAITNSMLTNCDLTGLPENTSIIGCNLQNCIYPAWFLNIETMDFGFGHKTIGDSLNNIWSN